VINYNDSNIFKPKWKKGMPRQAFVLLQKAPKTCSLETSFIRSDLLWPARL